MSTSTPSQPFRFSIDAMGGVPPRAGAMEQHEQTEDGLLRETRRELRRIVAEVASLCHSRVEPTRFWAKFLNLVGTAIAAEACIVWRRNLELRLEASHPSNDLTQRWSQVSHCGAFDERLLVYDDAQCHGLMLNEIGNGGGPVAVPPGSDWNSEEPGNPTDLLAAVVPVPVDPDEPVEWLVEFLLPPGGGPATQRGYLRFLAQMTDLAAGYLRAERLRAATRAADFSHRAALMLASLQQHTNSTRFPNYLVDAVGQFSAAERVCLVQISGLSGKVQAINGISKIDHHSPVVKAIGEIARETSGDAGIVLAESSIDEETLYQTNETNSDEEVLQSGSLVLRGVVILDQGADCRLVIEDSHPRTTTAEELERWQVLARQLSGLMSVHHLQMRSGLAKIFARTGHRQKSVLRRSFVPLGLLATIIIGGLIPVPLVISAKGHLHPVSMQTLYAPRAAVITEIYVKHDQAVSKGQPILQLEDDQLLQQIEQIQSRLAILAEQNLTNQDEQTRASGRDTRLLEELALQQRSIDEEIRSLGTQLVICSEIQDSLLLHASCDGRVDAWQLENNLSNRPIERGQPLLRIIPNDERWQIHAQIPQNRLDQLVSLKRHQDARSEDVSARLVVSAFPEIQLEAVLAELGPVAQSTSTMQMPEQANVALATFNADASRLPVRQSGAPVELGIPCGHRPLAYVLCQDLIRLTLQTYHLYR